MTAPEGLCRGKKQRKLDPACDLGWGLGDMFGNDCASTRVGNLLGI